MVEKRRKVDIALRWWINRRSASALAGWRERSEDLIAKRASVGIALRFWTRLTLGAAWAGWLDRTR
jgi:hypothetical protein